ncbi:MULTISPECIES: AAA family ATPase [Chelativorans]|jgi:SpoVK/Ycf46/Vps4 family AAA+-type ATPase|uniref:AAA ATPase, central region n=1 Tax=Chelativorans sp. (strain BNC1) TaxID=266779 RepID=Q11BR3_CHESB|nr:MULTISPECIES: ATP-binding protein [Chelativorans]
MEDTENMRGDFVHLARIALSDRPQDVQTFLRRIAKRTGDPSLSAALVDLLRKRPTRSSPLRRTAEIPLPVDTDSRFQLLRVEERPELPHEPIYTEKVRETLTRLIKERRNVEALIDAGLEPTRTILFTGPPGVGKTLAAKWLARELERPLLILDLSAVMSSYLGRTGSNLRHVLDYAKSIDGVLLLDELDAIAKRRDDTGEIGELKRLVTVLLQQLDDWPSTGLLIAATNHAELLDPAVWRRFEELVEFELPGREAASAFIRALLHRTAPQAEDWSDVLSLVLARQSFSDIERMVNSARRSAALDGKSLGEHLSSLLTIDNCPKQDRIDLAVQLVQTGLASQRRAHELTGVARDTIRERLKGTAAEKSE